MKKDPNSFTTRFLVKESPEAVFNSLLDVRGWWSGLYGEQIEGSTDGLDAEFSFTAGGGAHYSKQKLVDMVPGKRLAWLVTDARLSFVDQQDEWVGTTISFDIEPKGDATEVRFTHEGLVPTLECYDSCAPAWSQYLEQQFGEPAKPVPAGVTAA